MRQPPSCFAVGDPAKALLPFTEYTHPAWKSGMHHRLICQYLEAVERKRLTG